MLHSVGRAAGGLGVSDNPMARDTQAEYWEDLEAYEQRSLAAKRPKIRAQPQLPSAERYQGPVSPEAPSAVASSAAQAVEAIGAPSAGADDLADVPTDREDFDDSESDDEDASAAGSYRYEPSLRWSRMSRHVCGLPTLTCRLSEFKLRKWPATHAWSKSSAAPSWRGARLAARAECWV